MAQTIVSNGNDNDVLVVNPDGSLKVSIEPKGLEFLYTHNGFKVGDFCLIDNRVRTILAMTKELVLVDNYIKDKHHIKNCAYTWEAVSQTPGLEVLYGNK